VTFEQVEMKNGILELIPIKFSNEVNVKLATPITMEEPHLATKSHSSEQNI
jgi:hypothetical protein